MKRRAKWKVAVIVLTVVAVLAAAGGGGWYYLQNRNTEPVNVFPFSYIGMTEYWGDSQESYGPVATDRIQTVFLSDTQTVTEMLVSQGDTVKKGDILLRYDTSLSNIEMERERLELGKTKLRLDKAEDELWEIQNMKPMEVPEETPVETTKPDLGDALTVEYQISQDKNYDGSTMAKALILWLHTEGSLDNAVLEALLQCAEDYQSQKPTSPTTKPTEQPTTEATEPTSPVDPSTDPTVPPVDTARNNISSVETVANSTEESTDPTDETTDPTDETTDPTDETTDPTDDPTDPTDESTDPTDDPTDPTDESTDPTGDPTDPTDDSTDPTDETTDPTDETTDPTEESTEPSKPEKVKRFYVVIKTTENNMSRGYKRIWQGMEVTKEDNSFRIKFFDAAAVADHMLPKKEYTPTVLPEIDLGSGYTAEEIAKMKAEKEKEIRDLQFEVKMAEANYAIKKAEMDNGEVKADIDGIVVSLLSEEEAKLSGQPFVKVSDGGGYYVEAFIGELAKEDLQLGQEVTVQDWNTGRDLTGIVQSIGDFPDANGYWNGMGNPNVSYYPFTVFVDGDADLQEGTYVNVVYSTASTQQGIYLENPFLRTEQGQNYVYVQGADGKLEKRAVTTGKALWGSYTEILEGLTAEDLIAFPYGKNVVEGADTVESDLSVLYG